MWSGELYLENHRATYTTMARNKRSNRKSEFLMGNAEFLTVLEHLAGEEKARTTWEYEKGAFDEAWRTILKNQFHDILPGSAIEEVYEVSQKEYEAIEEKFALLGERLAQKIADEMEGSAGEIFVINSNGTAGGGLLKINSKDTASVDNLPEMAGKFQQDGRRRRVGSGSGCACKILCEAERCAVPQGGGCAGEHDPVWKRRN